MTTKTVPSVAKPSDEQIAGSAYCIWENEGRQHGRHVEHWLQAKAQLTADSAQDACQKAPGQNVARAAAQALPQAKKAAQQSGRLAKAPPLAASAARK